MAKTPANPNAHFLINPSWGACSPIRIILTPTPKKTMARKTKMTTKQSMYRDAAESSTRAWRRVASSAHSSYDSLSTVRSNRENAIQTASAQNSTKQNLKQVSMDDEVHRVGTSRDLQYVEDGGQLDESQTPSCRILLSSCKPHQTKGYHNSCDRRNKQHGAVGSVETLRLSEARHDGRQAVSPKAR